MNDKTEGTHATTAKRCAIYVRFSSDENQKETSNEDQIRECRELASRKGWLVLDQYIFRDSGTTGQTITGRVALQSLLKLAASKDRPFDYLLLYHSSRLSRDVGDANKLKSIFKFFGIELFIVADGMDSKDSSFDMMFVFKSLQDQQFLRDLSAHVRKGQTGRFKEGHFPGGGVPYGYRTAPHENVEKRGRYGRFEVDYVDLVTDPEDEAVIRRVFEAYADGMSYGRIAKMLNAEGVKPPQAPRLRSVASWSKSAILEILRNETYIGVVRWNKSYQEYSPITGKRVRKFRDESEWLVDERPTLRIVPQELWDRVCQARETRGKNGKQLGGLNSAKRIYLLSSKLYCGLCKHKMFIVNTRPSSYGCSDYRERGTCWNGLSISQEVLENRLVAALAEKLTNESLREELVRAVKDQIRVQTEGSARQFDHADSKIAALRGERAALERKAKNVADQLAEHGHSPTLRRQLNEYEARIEAIEAAESALTVVSRPGIPSFTDAQIRSFVQAESANFAEALTGDRETAREQIQKRISRLFLTPKLIESGWVYVVTGDVGLFAPEDLTQSERGELFGLRWIFTLSLEIPARTPSRRIAAAMISDGNGAAPNAGCCGAAKDHVLGDAGRDGGQPALEHDAETSGINAAPGDAFVQPAASIPVGPAPPPPAGIVGSTSLLAVREEYRRDFLPAVADLIGAPQRG